MFWQLQLIRYLLGLLYSFFVFYVVLIDQTPAAYLTWFVWVVGVGLIVDFLLFVDIPFTFLGGVLGGVILLAFIYMKTVYPFAIAKDKYEFTQAEISEQSLEPMNEEHLPVVPKKYALYKTEKLLGKVENYFYYDLGDPTIQKIDGSLFWVTPVEYQDFFKWRQSEYTPGYIRVSAEDHRAEARFVEAKMKVVPSAYFSDNLFRQVRLQYPDLLLVDASFEPDESGKPYYAVSYGRFEKFRAVQDIQGVILVDPASGEMKQYPLDRVPAFVDQIFPADVAWERNRWFGLYKHGFWNSIFGMRDVHRPTEWEGLFDIVAAFDKDNVAMHWITDHTRDEEESGSMVGYTMFNSRTGKLTYYTGANGMLNGRAATQVVEKTFREKQWRGANPILYNIYGEYTWLVPTLDSNGVLRQIVFVNARDEKVVGYGKSKQEALNQYQYAVTSDLQPDTDVATDRADIETISGKVESVHKTDRQDDVLIQFILEGEEPIFSVRSSQSPYTIFLEPGHRVKIEYINTGETAVAVKNLKNLTLKR